MTERQPRSAPRPLVLAGIAAVVALAVALGLGWGREESHLTRAQHILSDDDEFATATNAGVAFTRVSTILQEGGEACSRSAGETTCDHYFVTSAYARVSAVSLLSCTRRGVIQARAVLRSYLAALAEDPRAPLPAVPTCAT